MKAKFPYQKRRKRLGFGIGSGHGKTSTKGQKGQRSRSGFSQRSDFEGGQNPLYRRLPKRGFSRGRLKETYQILNVGALAKVGQAEISPETLKASGILKGPAIRIKVLGDGEIAKPVTVRAHRFSASAKEKIEKAGGQALLITTPPRDDTSE